MPERTQAPSEKKQQTGRLSSPPGTFDLGFGNWEDDLTRAARPDRVTLSPKNILALQRTVGNQVVQRLLAPPDPSSPRKVTSPPSPNRSVYPSHTQDAQTIQRLPAPKISSFASFAGSTAIQRRTVLASQKGHFHEIQGNFTSDDQDEKVKQIRKAKRRAKYNRFEDIEIDDDNTEHIANGMGDVVWYKLAHVRNQYVLAEKVLANLGPTQKEQDESSPELMTVTGTDLVGTGGGIINEVDNALVEVGRGYTLKTEVRGETLSSQEKTTSNNVTNVEAGFWAGGGSIGMVSGILGMAASLKDLKSDEKSTWEKVEAAFNLISSGSDTIGGAFGVTGGISTLVNTHSTEGTKQYDDSKAAGSWAFGFQAMFGTLSSGIKTFLDIISLVKMVAEQISGSDHHDRDEYLARLGTLLTNALETAKGVISSFRAISEMVNNKVTDAFEQVLPGFDIAISAVKTLFQGYYLVKSAYHWVRTLLSKRKAKKELKESGFTKKDIKQARKFYGKQEGMIANTSSMISKNEKGIAKREKSIEKKRGKGRSRFDFVNDYRESRIKKWTKKNTKKTDQTNLLKDNRTTAQENIRKYEGNEIDELGNDIGGLDDSSDSISIIDANNTNNDSEEEKNTSVSLPDITDPPVNHPKQLDLAKLELSSELKAANGKRVLRQSIHIVTNLVKIAGGIVTIVGGTGAPVGVALKAAAAGVDISLPFFRSLKQFGRNRAGKSIAKGKEGGFSKVFDANKSTVGKQANRKKQAVTILMLIADLNKIMPTSDDQETRKLEHKALMKQVTYIESLIYAAGISPKKLYRANGKPQEQIKLLVEAMCKRELF